jgi:hypothetical protein
VKNAHEERTRQGDAHSEGDKGADIGWIDNLAPAGQISGDQSKKDGRQRT